MSDSAIQSFIAQYGPTAAQVSQQLGVAPDVLLGHWGEETGWGKSVIPGTNNLGNIKGPGVAATDNMTGSTDTYRQYSSPQAFGSGFASMIGRQYPGAVGTGSDAQAYATALKDAGYAQDPNYVPKLTGAVNTVRRFGNFVASAISGTANAAEPMPNQQTSAAPAPDLSTDPLWQMMTGTQQGVAPASDTSAQLANDPTWQMMNAAQAPTSTAPTPSASTGNATPSQSSGNWKTPGGFVMGIGDAVRGGAQDIVHGLSWAADKIAPNSQFAQDARAALPQMQQTVDQQNAQYAAQRAANGGSGVDLARIAGNAVGTAPTLAIGPEYAGLSFPGKMALGAAQGAAGAGLMPTAAPQPDQSFAGQKAHQMALGAGFGAASPLVAGAAGWLGKGLWNVAQPVLQPGKVVGQGLANAIDPQAAADVAQNIRGAQQFVPGSMPTTAQAGANPVLVQTEKALANSSPDFKTVLTQRGIDNNDARWSALAGVAQDPATLDAAVQARSAAAQPLYDAAHQSTANVGPAFMRYAQIPEMQEAMQRANGLASLDAAVGRGVAPVWPSPAVPGASAGSNTINGAALDYTSRALGDMISEAQRAGGNTRADALTALKNNVDQWTQQYIPGVQQARAAYQAGSVPVNTMDVGQQIANSLGTRTMNAGGAPEIQMMPYRSALTSAMKGADYGIDPGALDTLQGIGQDLQRATVSNSIKSGGSDTAYNLAANGWLAKQLYGPSFQGAGNVGKAVGAIGAAALGHPMVGLGILGGGNKIGQMVGNKLQGQLSNYLLDPQAILPYLDARAASTAGQALPGPAVRGLLNYGRPAVVNGLLGGFLNPAQQK